MVVKNNQNNKHFVGHLLHSRVPQGEGGNEGKERRGKDEAHRGKKKDEQDEDRRIRGDDEGSEDEEKNTSEITRGRGNMERGRGRGRSASGRGGSHYCGHHSSIYQASYMHP